MREFVAVAALLIGLAAVSPQSARAKSYIAYISDSTNSSVIYWIAKEAGIFNTVSIWTRSLSTAVCAAFRA
jgi:hypothetical protein